MQGQRAEMVLGISGLACDRCDHRKVNRTVFSIAMVAIFYFESQMSKVAELPAKWTCQGYENVNESLDAGLCRLKFMYSNVRSVLHIGHMLHVETVLINYESNTIRSEFERWTKI